MTTRPPGRPWQALAPGVLPMRALRLAFDGLDPRRELESLDLEGFVGLDPASAAGRALDLASFAWRVNPDARDAMERGANHFGVFYSIRAGREILELREYGMDDPAAPAQRGAMRLLEHLLRGRSPSGRYAVWSEYWDSGEASDVREGPLGELRELLFGAEGSAGRASGGARGGRPGMA